MMGDEILRQIGLCLRQTARDSDFVGRPGGDELALLAPGTASGGASALAERLQRSVRSLHLALEITLSIGISVSSSGAEPAAAMFRRADQALYKAKRRGRNQAVVSACSRL